MPATCNLSAVKPRPGRLGRLWSAEAGIFLAVWLALLFFGRTELFRDPGTFWHTAAGQRILDRGEIVPSDPFSFTFPGKRWVENEWLADCGMALLYRFSGWDGLLLATATLLASVYAGLAARLLRAGLQVLPTVLIVGLALAASTHNFHARPLVITLALQAWMFARLVDVEAGRRPIRSLAWFVPVFALWGNCHGGVLAGIGTAGLVFAGWCLTRCSPVRHARDVLLLGAILAASLASVLLNPYGLDMPRSWASVLSLPLPQLIQEHAPLDLRQPTGMLAVMLAGSYLLVLAGVWPRRPRATWVLPLVWFVLAALRVRNAPLAAIVTVIALADLLPQSRWARWLAGHGMLTIDAPGVPRRPCHTCGPVVKKLFQNYEPLTPDPSPDQPPVGARGEGSLGTPSKHIALPATAVCLAAMVQLAGLHLPLVGRGWVQLDPARWPVALLPELRAIESRDPRPGPRIFNDMLFGGFLIFHTPRLPIFIDDRCEHYGRGFLLAYDRARRENPGQLDAWRRQYHCDFALVESGSPLDRYLDGNDHWTLIRRSGPAALWKARSP